MDVIENWIYPLAEPPKKTRQKRMQVLALGMSRSGTESLRRALQILGYDHVFHGFDMIESTPMSSKSWALLGRRKFGNQNPTTGDSSISREDFDALLGHCEAVTDQPPSVFASDLIKAYPEAKVILNRRDVDSWYRSSINAFIGLHSWVRVYVLIWFHPILYWDVRYAYEVFQPYFYGSFVHHGKWVYEEHSAKVRGLVPPEKLLEWTVGDGWEPLCRFLDKPIPDQEFPSGNDPVALWERYNKAFERPVNEAKRNLAILLLLSGALGAFFFDQAVFSWL